MLKKTRKTIQEVQEELEQCERAINRVGLVRELSELLEGRSGRIIRDQRRGELVTKLTTCESKDRAPLIQEFVDEYPQK